MNPMKQQLPKARVAYGCYMRGKIYCAESTYEHAAYHLDGLSDFQRHKADGVCTVAVIPTATAKQAKAIAAFFNLSEEEQVEAMTKAIEFSGSTYHHNHARAVLRRVKG